MAFFSAAPKHTKYINAQKSDGIFSSSSILQEIVQNGIKILIKVVLDKTI